MLLNLALWAAGVALLALGIGQARGPYARYRGLRAADENARRYDAWRGARRTADAGGITGADVMRQTLRSQVTRWALVAVSGVVLIVAGFAVR